MTRACPSLPKAAMVSVWRVDQREYTLASTTLATGPRRSSLTQCRSPCPSSRAIPENFWVREKQVPASRGHQHPRAATLILPELVGMSCPRGWARLGEQFRPQARTNLRTFFRRGKVLKTPWLSLLVCWVAGLLDCCCLTLCSEEVMSTRHTHATALCKQKKQNSVCLNLRNRGKPIHAANTKSGETALKTICLLPHRIQSRTFESPRFRVVISEPFVSSNPFQSKTKPLATSVLGSQHGAVSIALVVAVPSHPLN